MMEFTTLIVALKTITLVFGGLITYYAFKAYRRTRAPPLRFLAVGFAIFTIGAFIGGIFDLILDLPRSLAIIAETGLTVVGFGVIIFSLFSEP